MQIMCVCAYNFVLSTTFILPLAVAVISELTTVTVISVDNGSLNSNEIAKTTPVSVKEYEDCWKLTVAASEEGK